MIDIKLLRDNPEIVRASQRARGADESLVDQVLDADEKRRSSLQQFEQLRSQQKTVSKEVGAAMGRLSKAKKAGEDTAALEVEAEAARTRAGDLAAEVKRLEAAADTEGQRYDTLLRALDNVIIDGVPAGGEDDFDTLETVGTPREFDFEPLDHLALGEKLGAIDMERGAKVSGSRFYYLRGAGARLSTALMAFAQSIAAEEGFTPLVVPTLVSAATMGGTGYLDAHDDVYHLADDDLYLTGTSEVALAGYHTDEIIDLADGPLRYTATSTCYRREAGSYGKDTRGIFRVHQFTKTEMFVFCRPEEAVAEHQNLLRIERRLLDALELPYRVIDVAAGDLGGSAARKFDCEAWVPTQGKYRELTSTSNCTTYQARRLGIRYRTDEGRTDYVATLNGTMLTDTRPIVALLENNQQPDGSVRVPAALQPFIGTEVLQPVG
ncbi:serine--tRNA ligase [Calidifontibacter sp. DB0510]|uniref:Serine--tRNA ligase n=1 Tax=Metallococcus carri TaxID=1656884 RepID=A0A967B2R5_9MICO|nr:serine--tRNA ligase [Metallococcus carri]NHN57233.1 serine--tRNA ligase [Metallococcus carri]NOP37964.1 serine--tRNA ligase [Calidifontibacter sp. DB2511S]